MAVWYLIRSTTMYCSSWVSESTKAGITGLVLRAASITAWNSGFFLISFNRSLILFLFRRLYFFIPEYNVCAKLGHALLEALTNPFHLGGELHVVLALFLGQRGAFLLNLGQ